MPSPPPVPRWALVASAAAVVLVTGLAGWSYEQRNSSATMHMQDIPVSTLVNDSANAYPLDDSDLPVSATGVLFAEPQGREVYLVANGLPALPQNERYQVWLFTTNDQQQSAGLVTVGARGDLRAFLEHPLPLPTTSGSPSPPSRNREAPPRLRIWCSAARSRRLLRRCLPCRRDQPTLGREISAGRFVVLWILVGRDLTAW